MNVSLQTVLAAIESSDAALHDILVANWACLSEDDKQLVIAVLLANIALP